MPLPEEENFYFFCCWSGKRAEIFPKFYWGSGAALSLLGFMSLERGWWFKGTLVGFGISLIFCVVSSI